MLRTRFIGTARAETQDRWPNRAGQNSTSCQPASKRYFISMSHSDVDLYDAERSRTRGSNVRALERRRTKRSYLRRTQMDWLGSLVDRACACPKTLFVFSKLVSRMYARFSNSMARRGRRGPSSEAACRCGAARPWRRRKGGSLFVELAPNSLRWIDQKSHCIDTYDVVASLAHDEGGGVRACTKPCAAAAPLLAAR
jgi:hypothetical protein